MTIFEKSKKALLIAMAAVLAAACVSCGADNDDGEDDKPQKSSSSAEKEGAGDKADAESADDSSQETESKAEQSSPDDSGIAPVEDSSDEESKSPAEEVKPSEPLEDRVVYSADGEGQVLWETDQIRLTLTNIDENDFWGTEINVHAENKTENDLTIDTAAVTVNGYMVGALASIEAAAGEETDDYIAISSADLEEVEIGEVGEIKLYFYTYDSNTYDDIEASGCVSIRTPAYDSMTDDFDFGGTVLCDEGGIKISAKYAPVYTFDEPAVLMLIENSTDRTVSFSTEAFEINGSEATGWGFCELLPGTKAFTDVNIFSSDLEELGITADDIETLGIGYVVYDDDYNIVAEKDLAELKV